LTDKLSGSGESAALSLFEGFLTRFHDGEGDQEPGSRDFASLCAAHPEHADRFSRWWDQLVQTGEVSETPSAETVVDLPEEGGRFGSYKIIRELGRGSQGTVFLAEDVRLSRRVALKILPAYRGAGKDRSRRFAREAELASRLDHPGLCAVYERGLMGSTAYLSMRYVEGETLAAIVARARREAEVTASTGSSSGAIRIGDEPRGPSAEISAVLKTFEAVAAALGAAHDRNLIHRDVKPGNIVVDDEGHPVLLDFGLARDVESDMLTMTGDLLGTPAYMSPEQLAAQRIELDHRTDIYSLGATLYECLTLHRPFEAPTRNELYQQILVSEPTRPRLHNPNIGRDLEVVLLTALDKDRNRRYQTAVDFGEDLRRVRELEPIRARPAGVFVRFRRWTQRNPAIALSVILVFFALSVGLIVSLYYFSEARRYQSSFERLADQGHLENARRAAVKLYPIRFDKLEKLDAWLSEYGHPLRDRLPGLRANLVELQQRSSNVSAEDRERRLRDHPDSLELLRLQSEIEVLNIGLGMARMDLTRNALAYRVKKYEEQCRVLETRLSSWQPMSFASPEDAAVNASLTKLVAELDAFVGENGLLRRLADHANWLRRVRQETCEKYAKEWQDARAQALKIYGKNLPDQPGLIPLGVSKHGVLEFAHARSGRVPDTRDPATSELVIDGSTSMIFVLVQGGKFKLNANSALRVQPHEVSSPTVDLDWFFVSKYELTHGQWERMSGAAAPGNDMVFGSGCGQPRHPVESVLWQEAFDLLHEYGLLLPTEAQWEYAALAGSGQPWSWSKAVHRNWSPVANIRDKAHARLTGRLVPRFTYDDKFGLTAPVGSFPPNDFGIHDVHGNVSEWCLEPFAIVPLEYLPNRKGDGYHFVPLFDSRVARGGSCDMLRSVTYAARRMKYGASSRHLVVGVRPVRAVAK